MFVFHVKEISLSSLICFRSKNSLYKKISPKWNIGHTHLYKNEYLWSRKKLLKGKKSEHNLYMILKNSKKFLTNLKMCGHFREVGREDTPKSKLLTKGIRHHIINKIPIHYKLLKHSETLLPKTGNCTRHSLQFLIF